MATSALFQLAFIDAPAAEPRRNVDQNQGTILVLLGIGRWQTDAPCTSVVLLRLHFRVVTPILAVCRPASKTFQK